MTEGMLKAAAGDLYASCKWLEVYAQVQVRQHPDAQDTPQWQKLLDAVKKAEGDKPPPAPSVKWLRNLFAEISAEFIVDGEWDNSGQFVEKKTYTKALDELTFLEARFGNTQEMHALLEAARREGYEKAIADINKLAATHKDKA